MSEIKMEKHFVYLFKDNNFVHELNINEVAYNPYRYPQYFSCLIDQDEILIAYQNILIPYPILFSDESLKSNAKNFSKNIFIKNTRKQFSN